MHVYVTNFYINQVWQDVEAVKKALAPPAPRSVARVASRRRHRPRSAPPPPIADCPRTDADAREEETGRYMLYYITQKKKTLTHMNEFPNPIVTAYWTWSTSELTRSLVGLPVKVADVTSSDRGFRKRGEPP